MRAATIIINTGTNIQTAFHMEYEEETKHGQQKFDVCGAHQIVMDVDGSTNVATLFIGENLIYCFDRIFILHIGN